MKKIIFFFLCLIIIGLSACLKPKHSLRISNQNSRALNVLVGANNYGLVTPGIITSYQNIPEGTSVLGGDVKGTVEVSGKGTHKWTMTISINGQFTVLEDK